ncbi:amyloid beta A4 precursor protein-binding family B member 1-interacting protein isoform X1 [Hylaeus anthracinus]|uniref:amyloid beta A4 precursor protein-binding family B member 1-interacting protein isoform X1 n=1 Tax=Hylaeus volcanicus TaxID=313075 RepID=UPI0023B85956|nr:amyloid beta A4 precursor protein-binding family B member 1-interacting protein isoform X1 [Hylaeus volcanicus]XP_054013910.1 amyloid beta A4 precursor protein-binding family B member 1-interacting protein isoform X1 [Hylaeus anthracinus]
MDWMRRKDIQEESPETPTALTPDEPDECYFEEDTSIDEGMGLDNVSSATLRPFNSDINTPRIDSYRFSMANLEDSQDVDLDAILGELCALERRCDGDIAATPAPDSQRQGRPNSTRITAGDNTDIGKNEGAMRTDSPDNDSAFSDTVSMLSSESSASSSGSGHKPPQTAMHTATQQQSHQLMDAASRVKAEKIRLALEKMREASVQKLFIKAFTLDGSGKSLLVDEGMSVAHVSRLLADKNHVPMDPKWAVVEHLPDLFMERVYEDHELLVENLLLWTRDSKNKLLFVERPDKTQLFFTPERYLLGPSDRSSGEYDDHSRNILLEEFFSSSNVGVPEVEGPLYLKSDGKKGWKRYHFILRASGLYYWPKEKARTARDLVCLATFDVNQIYYGVGWKKKYKAPTDFCFAVKHPRLQQPKSTKYIKFLCAEDNASLERWMVGIRIAKYGRQLMENYRTLVDELAQEDLDMLAHARSCSVSSIAVPPQSQAHYNTSNDNARQFAENSRHNVETANARQYDSQRQSYNPEQRQSYNNDGRLSRASSSSSSGCLSDGAPSSCEVAFECGEFPTGTIKRKPSMNPKLPLTSITRQLKEVGETVRDEPDCPSPTSSGSGTLTRRHSRRRSGTDSDGSGTLKRHHRSGNATPVSPVPPGTPVRERASPMGYNRTEPQESKTPTSPIPTCMMDSITSLPPPPSPSRVAEEAESDSEPLPPPPPEMFRSNLSLDSLPPPPAPGEIPVCNTPELSGSSLSLASLPPPPSPLVGETGTIRRARPKQSTPTNSITPENTPTHTPSRQPANQQMYSSNSLQNNSTIQNNQNYNANVQNAHHANNTANSVSSPHSSYPGSNASTPTYAPSSPGFASPPPFIPPPAYGSQQQHTTSQSLTRQNSKGEPVYGSHQTVHQHNTIQPIRPNPNMDTVRRSAMKQTSSHYAAPPYLAELKAASSPQPQRRVTIQEPPTSPKSKTGTGKKITFNLPPQQEPGSPALPQRKPMPPRRSDSTRLTSPKKLAASDQAPPGDFLKDLQRVMRKKWQVAQKCKLDSTTTPHEVLGFRDPPPAVADYRETNVSNWVQEHYGADNLYENVYATDPHAPVEYASSPARQSTVRFADENRSINIVNAIASKRRPPPPPPKRAETTHLTTTRAMH